ncbi:hypothetical protein ABTL50_19265, partial [Acinetobacter baumannii]
MASQTFQDGQVGRAIGGTIAAYIWPVQMFGDKAIVATTGDEDGGLPEMAHDLPFESSVGYQLR